MSILGRWACVCGHDDMLDLVMNCNACGKPRPTEPARSLVDVVDWHAQALRMEAQRDHEIVEKLHAQALLSKAEAERDHLQKFKDYVHQRLDAGGVPFDPDPETNEKSGCRIGGRLSWLLERVHGRTFHHFNAYRIGPDIIAAPNLEAARTFAVKELEYDDDNDDDWSWVPLSHQIRDNEAPGDPAVCIGDLIDRDVASQPGQAPYVVASTEY